MVNTLNGHFCPKQFKPRIQKTFFPYPVFWQLFIKSVLSVLSVLSSMFKQLISTAITYSTHFIKNNTWCVESVDFWVVAQHTQHTLNGPQRTVLKK